MRKTGIFQFLVLALALFGILSAAWAKTDNVPAPNGTDDTTNIRNTINGASSGDTIAFSSGGQYKVTSAITLAGNLTYQGNGCTLNWIASSADKMFYLSNISNATVTGFIFNENANAGNLYVDTGCSNLTLTQNTFQNNSYSGSGWPFATGIMLFSLTNSTISFNTFLNDQWGITAYSLNAVNVTDNTFTNVLGDDMHAIFDGDIGNTLNVFRNIASSERIAFEVQGSTPINPNPPYNLPQYFYNCTSCVDLENNVITIHTNPSGNDGYMGMSIMQTTTGNIIKNNIVDCTPTESDGGGWGLEFGGFTAVASGNIFTGCSDAFAAPYPSGNSATQNLFVNCGEPIFDNYLNQQPGVPNIYANNITLNGTCPTVSVTASTPNGQCSPYTPGAFTFSRGANTSGNLVVNYTIGGTATNGTDYIQLYGAVLIPNGSSSAVVYVDPLNGGKNGNYTITATLVFGAYYLASTSPATVTINYNGTAIGIPTYVTIAATTANATEGGSGGVYTVTRSGNLSSAITVNYSISGTATLGVDYTAPSGQVTIPANAASATITLATPNNSVVDGVTTAIAALASGTGYSVGYPNNATVNICDNDIPTNNMMLFLHADTGVTQSGGSVSAWADYSGQHDDATQLTTANMPQYEGNDINGLPALRFNNANKSVLTMPANYYGSANGVSLFVVFDPTAANWWDRFLYFPGGNPSSSGPTNSIDLCRNGGSNDLVFNAVYDIANGIQPNSWQILEAIEDNAGNLSLYRNGVLLGSQSYQTGQQPPQSMIRNMGLIGWDGNPNDGYLTGDVAEVLTYSAGLSSTDRATVENYLLSKYGFVATKPTVTVFASPTSINEAGGSSIYTINRSGGTSAALTVYYTMQGTAVSGTDYTALPGSLTIRAGFSSANVTLTTIDRHLSSGSVTAQMALAANANYTVGSPYTASVTILDNDSSGGGMLSGSTVTASTSTYNLTSLGTSDWSHWNGSGWNHKSAGGSQISNVTQIGGGNYGSFHDASRNVSWSDGTPTGSNSDDQYYYWCNNTVNAGWTFTVPADTTSRTLTLLWGGANGGAVKLNAHLSDGSAVDYNDALSFPGSSGCSTQLETLTYHASASGQTLTITLTTTTGTSPSVDLDAAWLTTTASLPTVTVSASPTSINEAGGSSTYTVTRTGGTTSALTVNYAMSGTAVSGTDYTALSGSMTIAGGSSTGTVTLTGIDRGLTSGSKTAILTLSTNANYTVGSPSSASVTINDNDLPTLTVAASPSSISEKSGTSTYTVTRTDSTSSALTVNYAMSGTATNGTDYNTLSGSLTIASGSSTGTVTLTTIDRGLTSGSKTAIMTLSTNANYTVGAPSNATVTINDNDTSGGSLAGSTATASTSTYNLTSLGTTDWSHWNGSEWIHKSSGGSQISNVTQFGSGSYGDFSLASRNVSWSDGTPTTSNADDQDAIYCNNKANAGWTFTVPADTTTRTLYIMWGGYTGASVKLNAHLSDGSAIDYNDTETLSGSGSSTFLETITYHAAAAGKTLTITLTNISGTSASVDLDAAWLVAGGTLSGNSATASTSTYNLTSLGTTDWSHWNSGWIHKVSGGSQISNVTPIGGGAYGNYDDSSRNVSWTDGTPTTSNNDDTYYIWCNSTQNAGWTFTVPAGTSSHTLYILWGGYTGASVKLNAHLSDGSASDYNDAKVLSGSGDSTYLEMITFNAASAGQMLTITVTKTDTNSSPSVDLDAAWLQ